jgi:hypothetical protein
LAAPSPHHRRLGYSVVRRGRKCMMPPSLSRALEVLLYAAHRVVFSLMSIIPLDKIGLSVISNVTWARSRHEQNRRYWTIFEDLREDSAVPITSALCGRYGSAPYIRTCSPSRLI